MPADTFSTDGIGVLLMGTGNDNNLWGTNANTSVFQIFADAIANALVSTITGGTLDLSGSPPPAATAQAHYATLVFNGVLGSAQSIRVPNLQKYWWVINQTTGAFALTMKTPSGAASVPIPQNSGIQLVYCDGANNIVVSPFNNKTIQMADGTATSPAYSNINETNSGWYRNSTQDWRLSINGVDVLQVTGSGAASPSIVNALAPNVLQQQGNGVPAISGTPAIGSLATYLNSTTLQDGGTAGALATKSIITAPFLAQGAAPLPLVAVQPTDNLNLANDGSNPTRDVDIFLGRVRDDSDVTNLQLASGCIKRLDTTWSPGGQFGTPGGGCDVGTKGASQTWHCYVIGKLAMTVVNYARSGVTVTLTVNSHGLGILSSIRVSGVNTPTNTGFDGVFSVAGVTTNTISYFSAVSGTVATTATATGAVDAFDAVFSQSYPTPTYPSGWTVKQCIGSVMTDGSSNIRAFLQTGNHFKYKTAVIDVSAQTLTGGAARSTFTLSTPNGVAVTADIRASIPTVSAGNALVLITDLGTTDQAVGSGTATLFAEASTFAGACQASIDTNTTSQIGARASATCTISVGTFGWWDPRRRMF